jgi:NifU-like protein involved in Fe-S cluster formation
MTPEERVIEHYSKPYHRHIPPKANGFYHLLRGKASNKLCGDWIHCWVRVTSDDEQYRVVGVWWEGGGCCFSQAAASMLAEHVEARRTEEVRAFTQDDMLDLFRADIDPERTQCVMVAFHALQNALEKMP